MRIIAGIHKGRKLKVPSEKFTRPSTDQLKESLFNYLNNIIDFDQMKVLDIYAGSGALGLESLSRGAEIIHFVEKNYPVINVLNENIAMIAAEEKCKIYKMNATKFSNLSEHEKYDLIFADPPYNDDEIYETAKNILQNNFLEDEGLFIIERSAQTKGKDIAAFKSEPIKRIGDTLIYQLGSENDLL